MKYGRIQMSQTNVQTNTKIIHKGSNECYDSQKSARIDNRLIYEITSETSIEMKGIGKNPKRKDNNPKFSVNKEDLFLENSLYTTRL